jgi:hypothetical protein
VKVDVFNVTSRVFTRLNGDNGPQFMGILGETDAGFPEVRVHGGASKDDQLVYAIHALGGWE